MSPDDNKPWWDPKFHSVPFPSVPCRSIETKKNWRNDPKISFRSFSFRFTSLETTWWEAKIRSVPFRAILKSTHSVPWRHKAWKFRSVSFLSLKFLKNGGTEGNGTEYVSNLPTSCMLDYDNTNWNFGHLVRNFGRVHRNWTETKFWVIHWTDRNSEVVRKCK